MTDESNQNAAMAFRVIAVAIAVIVAGFIFCYFIVHPYQKEQVILETNDTPIPVSWYADDGYDDIDQWWNDIVNLKQSNISPGGDIVKEYPDILTEDQKTRLLEIDAAIAYSHSINEIDGLIQEANNIKDEALKAVPATNDYVESESDYNDSYDDADYYDSSDDTSFYYGSGSNNQVSYSGNSGDFKSQGVVYQDGTRYTYYSSNMLYHYQTPNWSAGDDGFYRDADGYLVVASDDYSYGSTVDTPWGTGKVYDSGCGSGTIDMYTNY